MSLDPKTIIITNIIGSLLMGLSLFAVARGYLGQIKGVTKWAFATIIQSLGWIILSVFRGVMPDIISILIGNGLLLLSSGLYFNILVEFNNKAVRSFWIYLLVGLEAIILAYFVLVNPDVNIRIAVASGCSSLLMFASSYILFSNKNNRPTSHLLTAGMFAICGFTWAIRSLYTFLSDANPHQLPFGSYPMQNISYLTFFITSVMLTFGFVLMCNDKYINERKQMEDALAESEEKFRRLLETAPDAMVIVDSKGKIKLVSHQTEKLFGYTKEELIGNEVEMLIPSHHKHGHHIHTEHFFAHPQTRLMGAGINLSGMHKNGNEIPVEISLSPLKTAHGILVSAAIRDISERKKAEDSLKSSEEKFSLLAKNATDIVSLHDLNFNYLYVSDSVKLTLGYEPEELIGKSAFDFIHPEDIEFVKKRFSGMLNRSSIEYSQFRIKKKDGNFCWVESAGNFTFGEEGKITGLTINTRDISERKQIEEQLIKNEKQLNDAQELAKIGSWELNLLTFELTWSKEHYRIFELEETTPDKLYNAYRSKIHPDDIPMLDSVITNAIEHGKGFNYEHRMICKNKNIKYVIGIGQIIKDEQGKPIRVKGTVQDITERKKDEEAIRQSELRYRTLAEASEDMVFIINPKGTIEYLNDYAARQFGQPAPALIGIQMADLFPSSEARPRWEIFQNVFISGQSVYTENPVTMNGNLKWLGTNLVALRDISGNITSVMGVARDITQRKKDEEELRQSELRYRTLAEASEEMVFIINLKGTIEYMNDFAARQFGQPTAVLIGKKMSEIFPASELDRQWESIQKVFKSGESAYIENPTILGGNLKWLGTSLVAIRDTNGNITSVMGVARDITQRKKDEEELIIAKNQAEHLAITKDRFLSNMSHEIRTPLNGIIGFTNLLLQNEFPPKQKQQLEIIKTSSDILLVLINDILDLAKINEGKMSLEASPFNLQNVINDIISTFELRFDKKELKLLTIFDKNIPNSLIGDPIRISQILINLINNSIKFTNIGGQLFIILNVLEQNEEGATIEFIISDTGIGIAKDKLESIFEPFVQSNYEISNQYEGTGLGLSIVSRLVSLMNGTISIESKLNEGTSVSVIIPFNKTEGIGLTKEKETVISSDDLEQIGHLKILLAEDNPINQLLAQTILNQFGFEVDTVENGKIAIEFVNKNQYDIILMDLKMPEMGGFEATKYIRAQMHPPKSVIPIIAITADVTNSDIEKYHEIGINDYVIKPFNQSDLLNKIIRLVIENRKQTGNKHFLDSTKLNK